MKKQTMTIDEKLNSVRAGVLGSNDGILTVVGVLIYHWQRKSAQHN